MYPMSTSCCRFVDLGFIFVYWTLNLSLSSSRYCIVPAPGRHGADLSRGVSVSYYPYRNRIPYSWWSAPQRRMYSDLSQRSAKQLQVLEYRIHVTTCQISLSRKVLPRLPRSRGARANSALAALSIFGLPTNGTRLSSCFCKASCTA